jgi:hypothetical protein
MTKRAATHPGQTQHGAIWRIKIDGMSLGGQAHIPQRLGRAQFRESFVPNMPQ